MLCCIDLQKELHVDKSSAGRKATLPWHLGKGPQPSVVCDLGAKSNCSLLRNYQIFRSWCAWTAVLAPVIVRNTKCRRKGFYPKGLSSWEPKKTILRITRKVGIHVLSDDFPTCKMERGVTASCPGGIYNSALKQSHISSLDKSGSFFLCLPPCRQPNQWKWAKYHRNLMLGGFIVDGEEANGGADALETGQS